MEKFEILFGIKSSCVRENCVILPVASKNILRGIGAQGLLKGKIYSSADTPYFTVIQTGIGHGLTGDAVLYLKDTACRNIILFGSCGLAHEKNGLSTGSLVSPFQCFSYESFSRTLFGSREGPEVFFPDKPLFERLISRNTKIKKVSCATVASLKLEEEKPGLFKNNDVFDMECSALFSAGKITGIKTAALFYISDIINKKPFYLDMDPGSKLEISCSIKTAAGILSGFFKNSSNS